MANRDKKITIRLTSVIILIYYIREILYLFVFSFLEEDSNPADFINGLYRFMSNLLGILLFIIPIVIISLIITGIPLYFYLNKKWRYKNIIIFGLPFVDFVITWYGFNLQDNIFDQLARVVLFAVSLCIILKLSPDTPYSHSTT